MFTVIVTGSRDWVDDQRVFRELEDLWSTTEGPFVVRHGDCPTGADRFASVWCELVYEDVYEIRYPAEWVKHGKAAGPIRNAEMVVAGADLCLAFPLGASRGTRNCMRLAREAGIPVIDCSKDL